MDGYTLLVPMNERMLNKLGKERNISGPFIYIYKLYTYNIYTNIYIYIYIYIYIKNKRHS